MKNVVICCSLEDENIELIKTLKGNPLLENAKLHFVHIFEIHVYTSDFSPYIFPSEDKYPEIEKATKEILSGVAKEVCTADELKNSQIENYFAYSPKQKISDYLTEVDADLVIVASKQKHGIEGLFSSSFTDHLVKYSACDIHVLRPPRS
ncbi:universal stress protein [Halobacteriovorax sp. HLS]|uniref:universal stress protein n=1 Tax=Halobacteriovorax sp. HLS TaxID=2234000 RepID=UPI000FD73FF4|nr:universal stress protein [Halobacteriovorax sp. HLS]